ncbi:MAG: OPT/YSL family transporter [Bacilli bacterium]|nr:OPT/YSL family transporter [Bacilli bacterium]
MFPNTYLFDIMFFLGAVLGVGYLYLKTKKWDINSKQMDKLIIILGISGIIFYLSANFFDSIFQVLKGHPWEEGGITFLAGAISALICFGLLFWFILKEKRSEFKQYMNVLVAGLVLGHAVGRIGCFCAGCCFGEITDSFLGVIFPKGSAPYHHVVNHYLNLGYTEIEATNLALTTKVLPTQLIEAIFLFILFGILNLIKKHQFEVYLISYGLFRFIIEFFRADDRGSLFGLFSPSQWLSLLIIIVGIISFILAFIKNNKLKGSK